MQNVITEVQITKTHNLVDSFFDWKFKKPLNNKGIRDQRLIENILNGGYGAMNPYFPTVQDKAAKLVDILTLGAPFIEANPRVALVALHTMLEKNAMRLTADAEAQKKLFVRTMTLGKLPKGTVEWLKAHTTFEHPSAQEEETAMRDIIVAHEELLCFLAEKETQDLRGTLGF